MTKQKAAEEEILHAKSQAKEAEYQNKAKSEFFAFMSHE
jgi:hypothetical protein